MRDWLKFSFRVWLAFLTAQLVIVVGAIIVVAAVGFVASLCDLLLR